MYKVVIVDDEMIVRTGLKSFIDWENHGFKIVGEARNGEEALKVCEEISPDIILTDIKMPKMEGIDLIKEIKNRWSHIQVIVLTCVNEFDILQQALRLGVKDYFLKLSFDPNQLLDILERVKQNLDLEQQTLSHLNEHITEQTPPMHLWFPLKEDFYRNAVRDQLQKLEPQVPLNINESAHRLFIIKKDCVYHNKEDFLELKGNLLKSSVINVLEEVLGRECNSDVIEINDNIYVAICQFDNEWDKTSIEQLVLEIQHSLKRFLNYGCSIGISQLGNALENFYMLYSQGVQALNQKFYKGHNSINFYEEIPSRKENIQELLTTQDEDKLMDELATFQFNQVRMKGLDIIDAILQDGMWRPEDFKTVFLEFIIPWMKLFKQYKGSLKEVIDQQLNPIQDIDSLETLEDIKIWYQDYTNLMEKLIRNATKRLHRRDEIEKAKEYVKNNYHLDINIKDVSKMVGFNSSYFSHLFKKETKLGFSEYLTKVRLQEAQKLLKGSTSTITEIAENVGYNDVAYFRKIFRQHFKKSPSEYRAQFLES